MKKCIFLYVLIIISTISCKKYGFNVENGYDAYVDSLPHATADTSLNSTDFSFINKATIFPGLVPLSEKRVDTSIEINLGYAIITSAQLKIQTAPTPLNNIGLYAAPGEPIKVIVPSGVYNLKAQIGPWTDNLSSKSNIKRYPLISASFQLYPGVNYIRNPFGGCIFISPTVSENKTIKIQVSGAVHEPDFFLGKTKEADWVNIMSTTKVPFFILRGKHVALVLPTSTYKRNPFTNPEELMTYWDWIYEHTYFKYTGLDMNASDPIDQAPQLPMYYVLDAEISVGYWHSGFPVMVTSDDINFDVLTNLNYLKTVGSWGALHENGHNNQMPNIFDVTSVIGETTCNLYSVFLAHETNISYKTLLEGRDNVSAAFDFLNSPKDTSIVQLDDPFAKIVMYAQLFNKMDDGWNFWPYLYKKARRQTRNSVSDIEKWNFLYTTACEFNKKDMAPFFAAWKIPISTSAKVTMSSLYSTLDKDIWHYNPVTNTGGDQNYSPIFSNTTWSVLNFDSEESEDENDVASNSIDGDYTTFWHSQYSEIETTYPHFISYDLKIAQNLTGLYFYQREGNTESNGRVKTVKIYASNNGSTWTSLVNNATLENSSGKQIVAFPKVTSTRYIKVEFTSSYNGLPYAAMAEVGAY